MQVTSIGSSSSGNSTLVFNDDTFILVDCGIPIKTVLAKTNRTKFDALLITHEHSDHIKSAGPLGRKTGTTIYVNDLIVAAKPVMFEKCATVNITDSSSYTIGSITVTPFSTKHDARHSLGFIFQDKDTKFCYMTDTGSISKTMREIIGDCNSYFIESDYDEELMQAYEGYDQELKDRITSNFGHLSNQQALELIKELDIDRIKVIMFGHLSPRTNSPEKLQECIKTAFPNHLEKFIVAPFEGSVIV